MRILTIHDCVGRGPFRGLCRRAGVEQGRTGNINQASNNCGVRQRQQAARTPNAGAQFVRSIRQFARRPATTFPFQYHAPA
jgi:hypothetical protein